MSVIGLLAGIGGFVKVRYLHDKEVLDNPIFRLHYRFTSAFFFGCCVLITAFDLFGKPIDCITNTAFPRMDVLNTYCWTQSTFTLIDRNKEAALSEFQHPGIGPKKEDHEEHYHSYYQWVPFLLFFQGILFYIPHWIWKQYEGGKIRNMTDGSRGLKLGVEMERKAQCDSLVRYLTQTLTHYRNLFNVYVICEALNFIIVVGNIFFINKFLKGVFLTYGTKVLEFSYTDQENRTDPMLEVFPRMTKCTFRRFGASGTPEVTDAFCLLPLNIAHEKIYIFLWFWLIILAVLSGLAVLYRLAMILSSPLRLYILRQSGSPSLDSTKMIVQRAPLSAYFLIHLLGKNLKGFLFKGLIDDLAMHFSNLPSDSNERSRFLRQDSKLPEWMSRGEPQGVAVYLPMEENPVKFQGID